VHNIDKQARDDFKLLILSMCNTQLPGESRRDKKKSLGNTIFTYNNPWKYMIFINKVEVKQIIVQG